MRAYTQLTLQERVSLGHMRGAQLSLREIARRLARSPSTIAREVRRNRCPVGPDYDGWAAHPQAIKRRQIACRPTRMAHPTLAAYVRTKLSATYSPEQIVGRLRQEQPARFPVFISHQTIYTWLDKIVSTAGSGISAYVSTGNDGGAMEASEHGLGQTIESALMLAQPSLSVGTDLAIGKAIRLKEANREAASWPPMLNVNRGMSVWPSWRTNGRTSLRQERFGCSEVCPRPCGGR